MSNNDDGNNTKYLPSSIVQNPSSTPQSGQDYQDKTRALVENILSVFYQLLPSNYVSQVTGPFYTLQFQAAAEQIAKAQVALQEVFYDSDVDFTRPEFLYQIIGSLVFPDADDGIPQLDGDLTYRTFLKRMILLLLDGATATTIEQGLELLTDADIEVIEKAVVARDTPGSAWGFDEQHELEINIRTENCDSFPDDPFVLQENARLVIRALKPATKLFQFRFLFCEAFGPLFEDEVTWELDIYRYEDFRKYCLGAKELVGSAGETLTDRGLFRDPYRSFRSISPGAVVTISSGANAGRWIVKEILVYPLGDDSTPRSFTTSPSSLTGTLTITDGVIEDITASADFSDAVEGEVLTIADGPNAGPYRLETLISGQGGPVGTVPSGSLIYRVTPAPSLIRIERRMPVVAIGQAYTITVDRLGIQIPRVVLKEDHSAEFTL